MFFVGSATSVLTSSEAFVLLAYPVISYALGSRLSVVSPVELFLSIYVIDIVPKSDLDGWIASPVYGVVYVLLDFTSFNTAVDATTLNFCSFLQFPSLVAPTITV